jgi:rSAM/selenodomain-associated transferase 1
MFAKYWQPGQVKTRLGHEIGHQAASQLYRQFVQTLLAQLSCAEYQRQLVFTPASRRPEFERLCEAVPWQLVVQADGNLGQRISDFFSRQLDSGAECIVLIGSDSPTLPIRRIDQAFDSLDESDIVLGPSCDGGYYLIGLKNHLPALFSEIRWSTPSVLQQTLDRIADAYPHFKVQLLEPWYDVDTSRDLRRLYTELVQEPDPSAALAELRDLCASVLVP